MFALYLTNCETFAKLLKCQKFDLENKGEGKGGKTNESCPVRLVNFSEL